MKKFGLAKRLLAGAIGASSAITYAHAKTYSTQTRESIERANLLPSIGAEAMDQRTKTTNIRVLDIQPIIAPGLLTHEQPIKQSQADFVVKNRLEISDIIHGRDDRLLCIVGPCSIHDVNAALEYGKQLKGLIDEFSEDLLIVMRVYFEKPRTTIGWKGLLNDPNLNGTFDINKGVRLGRKLLLDLVDLQIGTGVEWLDTITPQFLSDVVCWGAIGARTTESQIHRQLVSGLSMPVGFKNGTSGDFVVAANGVISAKHEHVFSGVTQQGMVAIIQTTGNDDCHIIHRGGTDGTNYDKKSVSKSVEVCKAKGVKPAILIDCSHGNSNKDYRNQPKVASAVSKQVSEGSNEIIGVMIESNIKEGKQKLIVGKPEMLEYGKSITDSCVNMDTTREMLANLAQAVQDRRKGKTGW